MVPVLSTSRHQRGGENRGTDAIAPHVGFNIDTRDGLVDRSPRYRDGGGSKNPACFCPATPQPFER